MDVRKRGGTGLAGELHSSLSNRRHNIFDRLLQITVYYCIVDYCIYNTNREDLAVKKEGQAMPPKKRRRTNASRPAPPPPPVEEQEQPEDPRRSPPPDEEERAAAADPVPELELEPEAVEAEEDAPARRRAAPRVVTNFSEDEKELIIDFLQRNPTLYSKRLAGYKDAAAKDRLWTEQARQMKRTPHELKTWYDSMRTKLGKLKKAVTKSGQAADRFTATER